MIFPGQFGTGHGKKTFLKTIKPILAKKIPRTGIEPISAESESAIVSIRPPEQKKNLFY